MRSEFKFHKLNESGISKASVIAELFDALLGDLEIMCGQGREFSLVRTKLEEASFFAKKAMAMKEENQSSV
jgi:hypothetical protein